MAKVAIYARVSTFDQTCENQKRELGQWAARAGHEVVKIYEDAGISGTKGRDKRQGFDALLKGAVRREFDMIAVWSSDRLGRSMPHLLEVLQTLRGSGVGLYVHTQALDTSTPSGRALFQMLGVFAELEREMIVVRVNAGLARARQSGTRSGKAIGRPGLAANDRDGIRLALLEGCSVREASRKTGLSVGTIAGIRKGLIESGALAA